MLISLKGVRCSLSNELKRLIHNAIADSDDPVAEYDDFLDWMIYSRQHYVDNDKSVIPYEDKVTELELQSRWWRGGK